MNTPTRIGLVELVTHTLTCVNGENVVLRKREWVRSDDSRVAPPLVRVWHDFVGKSIDERTGRAIISRGGWLTESRRPGVIAVSLGYPAGRAGISRQKGRDLPRRSRGIPMGSAGILACKSFRSWDQVKKKIV